MIDRDEIVRMARLAGIEDYGPTNMELAGYRLFVDALAHFAALIAAAEREACLKIADQCADADMHASMVANSIRAMGKT